MKNLLFILFVILLSCEENIDPEYCWTCYRNTKNVSSASSYEIEICGQTEKEIQIIIDDNTSTFGTLQKWMECHKKY
jgi:hypothetical protein